MFKRWPLIRLISPFISCVLMLAAFAISVGAQSNKGAIKGTITDQNGAVVPNATVTVTKVDTNTTRTVKVGDDGIYEVPLLEPGIYKLTVTAPSFADNVHENIKVDTASTASVDVTLTAGQVGGTVTITAAQSTLQPDTSDLGSVIQSRQVTDLPIPQRNFTLLATLSPGVTRPFVGVIGGGGNFEAGGNPVGTSTESTRFRESGGSVLVVNGARPTSNNFTLDGTDSHLARQTDLRAAIEGAGLRVTTWEDRTAWAQQWFQRALAASPPSGPSLFSVLDRGRERAQNFARALMANQLSLVEVIARA